MRFIILFARNETSIHNDSHKNEQSARHTKLRALTIDLTKPKLKLYKNKLKTNLKANEKLSNCHPTG